MYANDDLCSFIVHVYMCRERKRNSTSLRPASLQSRLCDLNFHSPMYYCMYIQPFEKLATVIHDCMTCNVHDVNCIPQLLNF